MSRQVTDALPLLKRRSAKLHNKERYSYFMTLYSFLLTSLYSTPLVLIFLQAPVQSLEQLSRQSRINYTVVQDSDTHSFFRNMKNAEDTLYRCFQLTKSCFKRSLVFLLSLILSLLIAYLLFFLPSTKQNSTTVFLIFKKN